MDDLSNQMYTEIDFEAIFDAFSDLVCVLDPEHKIIHVNQAIANALGVSSGSFKGSKCFWNMHLADEPPTLCANAQMLNDGQNHTIEFFIEPLAGWFSITVAETMK